jgi:predicted MPP superfamily phosphohydrolase
MFSGLLKIIAAGLLVALVIYGGWIEPHWFEITRHQVGAPTARTPLKIVQLSDLHLVESNRASDIVIAAIQDIKPDVIVLSGDVVDRSDSLQHLGNFLNSLGTMPKIATLGNWEYWSKVDLNALRELYLQHNVTLLVNDCITLNLLDRQINFVGLDDALAGKPNAKKALARCEQNSLKSVLITHSPSYFGKPLAQAIANPPFLFALSGHTHGGQITFFGYPFATPPGSGTYSRGWYDTKYGPLYVSRGIGMTEVPMRLGARPEIAVFEVP